MGGVWRTVVGGGGRAVVGGGRQCGLSAAAAGGGGGGGGGGGSWRWRWRAAGSRSDDTFPALAAIRPPENKHRFGGTSRVVTKHSPGNAGVENATRANDQSYSHGRGCENCGGRRVKTGTEPLPTSPGSLPRAATQSSRVSIRAMLCIISV